MTTPTMNKQQKCGGVVVPTSDNKLHSEPSHDISTRQPSWYQRTTSSLIKFWYCDPGLSPLSGKLRMFYYCFLLLAVMFPESKLFRSGATYHLQEYWCRKKAEKLIHYKELAFQPNVESGFMGRVFASLVSADLATAIPCRLLGDSIRVSLFLSSIGFGGRIPRIVSALVWFVMVALGHAHFGKPPGHAPNLPAVALICLSLAENNLVDGWSVDSQLLRLYRYFFPKKITATTKQIGAATGERNDIKQRCHWQSGYPSIGGAAKKFILFQATCVMFFAGVHKVSSYGVTWLDGATMAHSIAAQSEKGHGGRSQFLIDVVTIHFPYLLSVIATTSVVGELGSVVTLLSIRWRHFMVVCWVMFHVGVALLMMPNFIMNAVTYSLIVDWRRIFPQLVRRDAVHNGYLLKPQQHESQKPSNHGVSSNMKLGAWMYSAVALVTFVASLLRIDSFPLSSYSLYNWHPSEPGVNKWFTADGVQQSAHRCITEPPLNPSCQNLGGTRHHDTFLRGTVESLSFVTIIGNSSIATKGLSSVKRKKCTLGIYDDYAFNPYSCWKPDKNVTSPLDTILTDILLHSLEAKSERKPNKLKGEKYTNLPSKLFRKGLEWRAIDAAGATFAEGGLQCLNDKTRGMSTYLPSPFNSASRFARQIRTHMGSEYLGKGLQVLGVGLIFEYSEEGYEYENSPLRKCLIGSSVAGEPDYNTKGDHEIGVTSIDVANVPKPGLKAWMDIFKGIGIVVVIGILARERIRSQNLDD